MRGAKRSSRTVRDMAKRVFIAFAVELGEVRVGELRDARIGGLV